MPFTALAAAPLILLPGAVFVLWQWDKLRAAGARPLEVCALAFALSILASAWAGLALAEFRVFTLLAFVVAWGALLVVEAMLLSRRAPRLGDFGGVDRWDFAGLALLVLAAGLFFRPAEWLLGGVDPGVYLNTGLAIERHGASLLPDPETPRLSPTEREALYGWVPDPWHRSGLPGFVQADFRTGLLMPQFFHLYPAWLAVCAAVGGLGGALAGTPVLILAAAAGVLALGRRVAGGVGGVASAAFFSLNVGVVWFARIPAAESLAVLAVVTGALLATLAARADAAGRKGGAIWAVAGAALGLGTLAKIDLVILPAVCAVVLAAVWVRGAWRPGYGWFAVGYAVALAHAALHAVAFSTEYLIGTTKTVVPWLNWSALDLADPDRPYTPALVWNLMANNAGGSTALLLGLVGAAGAAWALRRLVGAERWLPSARAVGIALSCVLLALLLVGAFARAGGPPGDDALGRVIQADRESVWRLAWYVSPIGLALAVVGAGLLVSRRVPLGVGVLLAAAAVEATLFLARGMITPVHFWSARRYLPLVFPVIALAGGVAVSALWSVRSRWRLAAPAIAALQIALLAWPVAPIATNREYMGAANAIGELNGSMLPGGVAIVQWAEQSARLATPLMLAHDRALFSVQEETLASPGFRMAVQRWEREGRAVYYVRESTGSPPAPPGLALAELRQQRFSLPRAEETFDRLPRSIVTLDFTITLYELRSR